MTHLAACPSCARHVRVSETLCPFCAASLPDELRSRPPQALPASRLSRAATYALGTKGLRGVMLTTGAAITAATLSSCSAAYGSPPRDLGAEDLGSDATTIDLGTSTDAAIDLGAAPVDAGTDAGMLAMYGGPPPTDAGQDAGVDFGGGVALYGAPPA